tara:strand:+ start:96 stop:494 length:399 start_codon:yes stop_codon:yes gene_type:complete
MVKTPEYYNGKNGYTAREVVENFDLNYNLGTACTYILRAYRKHKTPNRCLEKAIHHLQFELESLQTEKNKNYRKILDQYKRGDYIKYLGTSRSKHLIKDKKYKLTCTPFRNRVAIINEKGRRMVTNNQHFEL